MDKTLAAELDLALRRLRSFGPGAWLVGDRRTAVRRATEALAAATAPGRTLPDVADHGLADRFAVVCHDAIANGRRDEVAAAVREVLDATR